MRCKPILFPLIFLLALGWAGSAAAERGIPGSHAQHPSRQESQRPRGAGSERPQGDVADHLRGDSRERLRADDRERLRGDLEQFSQQQPERAEIDRRRQYFRERAKERFRNADTNGNGLLNREELSRLNSNAAANFDEIDQDRDGELSEQEVAQILRNRLRPQFPRYRQPNPARPDSRD